MRPTARVAGGIAVVLAVALGGVQLASMAVYGDLARVPSVPGALDPRLGLALARPLANGAVPAPLRAAYARALVHRGDVEAARAIVAGLPDSPTAADLRGQLAETSGDVRTALDEYVRARDVERAQRLIDAFADERRLDDAIALETRLARALSGTGDAGVRARAFWRLGQLTQAQAVATPADAPALERRSLECYERALALAPNEETYLLAAGQQALTLGDRAAAAAFYRRALDAVPNSADARAGLQRSGG